MFEIVLSTIWDERGQSTIEWASKLVKNGRALEIIDPFLSDFPTDDVLRFINVAFLCIQDSGRAKIKTHHE